MANDWGPTKETAGMKTILLSLTYKEQKRVKAILKGKEMKEMQSIDQSSKQSEKIA